MSLKLMTFARSVPIHGAGRLIAYILMAKMLQQLELSVGALREDRSAKRLHDLLDRHRLTSQLIFGRTEPIRQRPGGRLDVVRGRDYQTSPNAPMPTGCKSVYLAGCQS